MDYLSIFCKVFIKRFKENSLTVSAGHLTYNTMLALVPLIMVSFSIFTAFPIFNEVTDELKNFIYHNFLPNVGDVVQNYIDSFVENSKKASAIGTMALIAVALLLIYNIDTTLNRMWKKTKDRPVVISFAIYWMILTLGPLLVALSISISTYVLSLDFFNSSSIAFISSYFISALPFVFTWLLFALIYTVVPNTPVLFRHSAIGALVAAICFTIGKQIFVWYILSFPSYQAIYGALAVLPIMIVWINLSWLFVLVGAQICAVLKDMMLINLGINSVDD